MKRRCTATTDAGRNCRAWAVHGTSPALCPAHAGHTQKHSPLKPLKTERNGNGHRTQEDLSNLLPPIALRELADVDELPYNELVEIRLALATTQEATNEALGELTRFEFATDGVVDLIDRLVYANNIRAYYTARLNAAMNRLGRGDVNAMEAAIKAAEA